MNDDWLLKNMNWLSTHLISDVLTDETFSWSVFRFPAEQRRNADDSRQDPDSSNHSRHASRRPLHGVLEWTLDDKIPVDANGAQVEYRRRTQQNVQRCPDIADCLSKRPSTHRLHKHVVAKHSTTLQDIRVWLLITVEVTPTGISLTSNSLTLHTGLTWDFLDYNAVRHRSLLVRLKYKLTDHFYSNLNFYSK